MLGNVGHRGAEDESLALTYHSRNSEITFTHLFGKPIDLSARIGEDDRLCDGQRFVEIAQRVQFPLL